ncbi:methyltransferase domain-containing protein [Colletotrichum cuscutae]|uniref:Methyltransferase domain-containing protein n=1 Tax=Colletotrichum cuscutae TaxID=1209917 RepID=A0AAI9XM52_9PEZI|nr:methyltransferase domain-containing protein [Colletotrichum cuscutae]
MFGKRLRSSFLCGHRIEPNYMNAQCIRALRKYGADKPAPNWQNTYPHVLPKRQRTSWGAIKIEPAVSTKRSKRLSVKASVGPKTFSEILFKSQKMTENPTTYGTGKIVRELMVHGWLNWARFLKCMPAQAFLHIYTFSDYTVRLGCSYSSIGKVVLNAARILSKAHVKISTDPRLSDWKDMKANENDFRFQQQNWARSLQDVNISIDSPCKALLFSDPALPHPKTHLDPGIEENQPLTLLQQAFNRTTNNGLRRQAAGNIKPLDPPQPPTVGIPITGILLSQRSFNRGSTFGMSENNETFELTIERPPMMHLLSTTECKDAKFPTPLPNYRRIRTTRKSMVEHIMLSGQDVSEKSRIKCSPSSTTHITSRHKQHTTFQTMRWITIGNKFFLAPIKAEVTHRILDVGTGTGIYGLFVEKPA